MIKGRLSILRTAALKSVTFVPHRERQFLLSADIIVSGLTARGKRRFHCVPSLFDGRVEELPAPFASSDTPDHYDLREKTRREYSPGNAFDNRRRVAERGHRTSRQRVAWPRRLRGLAARPAAATRVGWADRPAAGRVSWSRIVDAAGLEDFSGRLEHEIGFLKAGDAWEQVVSFLRTGWITREWGQYLDVVLIEPPRSQSYQITAVLRKS